MRERISTANKTKTTLWLAATVLIVSAGPVTARTADVQKLSEMTPATSTAQSATGPARANVSPVDQAAFDRHYANAKHLYKIGKFQQSAIEYKAAVDIPHQPNEALRQDLHDMVSKALVDPNAHLALGIYCMNKLNPKFMVDPVGVRPADDEADVEFKTAIALSPDGDNAEAQQLLVRLAELEAQAAVHNHRIRLKPGEKRKFIENFVQSRWKPSPSQEFRLVRIQIKQPSYAVSTRPEDCNVWLDSSFDEFDSNALNLVKNCVAEFPYLNWGHYLTFVSGPGTQTVFAGAEESAEPMTEGQRDFYYGGLTDAEQQQSEAEQKSAKEYLEKYCTQELLNKYCTDDTKNAMKYSLTRLPKADLEIGGELDPQKLGEPSSTKISWDGLIYNQYTPIYRVRVTRDDHGQPASWLILFGAKYANAHDVEEFVLKQKARDALFTALVNYEVAHFSALKKDEVAPRVPPVRNDDDKLVYENDKPALYTCKLKDGRLVEVKLNGDASIKTVSVNGVLDTVWTRAYTETTSNGMVAQAQFTQ